jgi:hypothetical protein
MKRRPVDSWFWDLFVLACGSKCCVCGRPEVKLERGHIIPYCLGGTEVFDNVLPICLPCNRGHLKKATPDNRPADWREKLFLFLGQTLQPKLAVKFESGLCNDIKPLRCTIQAAQTDENARVIDWQTVDGQSLFTHQSDTTKNEAEALLRKLVRWSQANCGMPPRVPSKSRQTELVGLAMQHGRDVFWNAGMAFLKAEPWMPNVKGHDIERDSWQPIAENFYIYEEKWHRSAANENKQREREREIEREMLEQGRVRENKAFKEQKADFVERLNERRELVRNVNEPILLEEIDARLVQAQELILKASNLDELQSCGELVRNACAEIDAVCFNRFIAEGRF